MAEEKKLIIDEDWKSQVQSEKEEAAKAKGAAPSSESADPQDVGDIPMPPASFELLVTMLATEALVALGQIPNPMSGELHVHRGQAQYLIDLLNVLHDKTKGNLSNGEQALIESVLHQLRMVFVETAGGSDHIAAAPPA